MGIGDWVYLRRPTYFYGCFLAETKIHPTSYPEGEVWDEFWGNDETISDQYQPLG
ncbi:MAG: hypothetical protein ACSI46_28745 [Gloeotrichia echinulata DVL01]|nr:hypothetical protein [Gloeotrichia echinulata DEX184]